MSTNLGLTVPPPGILEDYEDVDEDPLTGVLMTGPAHGTLTLNLDGSFTYVPAANYNGTDTFTYQASDGILTSDPATVTITVTPVNDAPAAASDTYSTNEDTPLTIPVAQGLLSMTPTQTAIH